jgi:hypothetical protein
LCSNTRQVWSMTVVQYIWFKMLIHYWHTTYNTAKITQSPKNNLKYVIWYKRETSLAHYYGRVYSVWFYTTDNCCLLLAVKPTPWQNDEWWWMVNICDMVWLPTVRGGPQEGTQSIGVPQGHDRPQYKEWRMIWKMIILEKMKINTWQKIRGMQGRDKEIRNGKHV